MKVQDPAIDDGGLESHSLRKRTRDARFGSAGEQGVSGSGLVIGSGPDIGLMMSGLVVMSSMDPRTIASCSSLVYDTSLVPSEICEQLEMVRDRFAMNVTKSDESMGDALITISSFPRAIVTDPDGLCCGRKIDKCTKTESKKLQIDSSQCCS